MGVAAVPEVEEEKETKIIPPKNVKIDYLMCTICEKDYNDDMRRALSLHCGHTLCSMCASLVLINSKIRCPIDKNTYSYSSVNEIGRNFTIQAILDH